MAASCGATARASNRFVVVTHWRTETLWLTYNDDPITQRMWANLEQYLTAPTDCRIYVEPGAVKAQDRALS